MYSVEHWSVCIACWTAQCGMFFHSLLCMWALPDPELRTQMTTPPFNSGLAMTAKETKKENNNTPYMYELRQTRNTHL